MSEPIKKTSPVLSADEKISLLKNELQLEMRTLKKEVKDALNATVETIAEILSEKDKASKADQEEEPKREERVVGDLLKNHTFNVSVSSKEKIDFAVLSDFLVNKFGAERVEFSTNLSFE